jgi:hypothetical protein
MLSFLALAKEQNCESTDSILLTYGGDDCHGVKQCPAEVPLHAAVRLSAVVSLRLGLADHRLLKALEDAPRCQSPILAPQDVEFLWGNINYLLFLNQLADNGN